MTNDTITIITSSPDDLSNKLSELMKDDRNKYRYISLAISGVHVTIRPFSLLNVSIKDLKDRLKLETVELLSLPANDVEVDFQIFDFNKDEISGVFICISKEILRNFLAVVEEANLIPIKLTAHTLVCMDSFFQQKKNSNERYCFLHFSDEKYINMAVFNNQKFEFIRKVPYENLQEAKGEVIQSLRSICARSHTKQFNHIYFSGQISSHHNMAKDIGEIFSTKTIYQKSNDIDQMLSNDNFFRLNLLRNYSFSLEERKKLMVATHIVIFFFLIGNFALGVKIFNANKQIKQLGSSTVLSDYEQAKNNKTTKGGV